MAYIDDVIVLGKDHVTNLELPFKRFPQLKYQTETQKVQFVPY